MKKKYPPSRLVRVSDRLYCCLKKQAERRQTTIKAVLDQLIEEHLQTFCPKKLHVKGEEND